MGVQWTTPRLRAPLRDGCLARRQNEISGSALAGQGVEISAIKSQGFESQDGDSGWGGGRK